MIGAALLLWVSLAQDDPAALVERLRSDSVVERDDAIRKIKALGRAAVPALERAAADPDAEVAARARRLLDRQKVADGLSAETLAARPDAPDGLLAPGDAAWTRLFIDLAQSRRARRSDLEFLAARALRGAASAGEVVQIGQALSVRRIRSAIPDLVKVVETGEGNVRGFAMMYVVAFGPDDALPAIESLRNHESPAARAAFLKFMESLEVRWEIPFIAASLKDPDRDVRWTATETLGSLGAREGAGEIAGLVDDPEMRFDAIKALGKIGAAESIPVLRGFLGHEDAVVRSMAVFALGETGRAEAVPDLIEALKDSTRGIPAAAADGLARLGHAEAFDAVLAAYRADPAGMKRTPATLARLDDLKAGSVLPAFLESETGERREGVVIGMNGLQPFEPRPELVRRLGHPSEEVRDRAFKLCELLLPRGATADVVGLLASGEESVRVRALDLLGHLGSREAVAPLRKALAEGLPKERLAAARALGRLRAVEAAPDLRKALRGDLALPAARALALIGEKGALGEIAALLPDAGYGARMELASTLGILASEDAVPSLKPLLKDSRAEVRAQAIRALEALRARSVSGDVSGLLRDPDPKVREAAAGYFGRVRASDGAPLIALLGDEEPKCRGFAARALGLRRDRDALPGLVELLSDDDPSVRGHASAALGRIGDRGAIAPSLKAPEPETRAAAIEALGAMKAGEGIEAALGDRYAMVRAAAAGALGAVGKADRLAGLLADPAESVRSAAMMALVRVKGREAVPHLRGLLEDDSWGIRDEAAEQLCLLGARDGISRVLQRKGEFAYLNALRKPEVWKRLESRTFEGEPRGTFEDIVRAVAGQAGLAVERAPDLPLPPDPGWLEGTDAPVTLREALESVQHLGYRWSFILEDDRVRLVPRAEALRFWRAWADK